VNKLNYFRMFYGEFYGLQIVGIHAQTYIMFTHTSTNM